MRRNFRENRSVLLLAGLSLLLPACSRQSSLAEPTGHEVLSGKVTYKGLPVPYGYVLIYNQDSLNRKVGTFAPVTVGPIKSDGTYEVHMVPVGPVLIGIATDPDSTLQEMLSPTPPHQAPRGTPAGAPAIITELALRRDTPDRPVPPGAESLTDEQKATLRAIHDQFSGYGKTELSLDVQPGEQTFDIHLK